MRVVLFVSLCEFHFGMENVYGNNSHVFLLQDKYKKDRERARKSTCFFIDKCITSCVGGGGWCCVVFTLLSA